ncbi:MAG TPA: sugar ABC transporter substrate-binding protein [Firmicutes bacterium]|jgi:ribose transport system substrate-binding protein|nr:sugar ABC transporter substrate-binding protein [Bacillota bacterium]
MKSRLAFLLVGILLLSFVFSAFVSGAQSLPKGNWVIALSNSYYGNTWRKQMVDAFVNVGEEAKKKGYIKNYIVVNGDGTQNTQIAQMNSLILKRVNAICINAASPTALNGVIEKANKAGIKVLAFDSIADSPYCYKMDFDFVQDGVERVDYVAKRFNGKANVVQILGVSGSAPAIRMLQGQNDELKKYPNIKVVAQVQGEASASVAQQNMANIIPSLPQVDAVLTQAGNASYGVVQAFEASGKPMPLILGDNTSEFLQWWLKMKREKNYETISLGSAPGIGGAAFWVSLAVLNKVKVPKEIRLPLSKVTQDDVDKYSEMKPGTVVSPDFTYEYVLEHVINTK